MLNELMIVSFAFIVSVFSPYVFFFYKKKKRIKIARANYNKNKLKRSCMQWNKDYKGLSGGMREIEFEELSEYDQLSYYKD